jgi:dihydroorotase-like cyclic amidohydrolase
MHPAVKTFYILINLQDLNRLMSVNTSRLAGLEGRKGHIAKGNDADFVVWDPEETFVVDVKDIRKV